MTDDVNSSDFVFDSAESTDVLLESLIFTYEYDATQQPGAGLVKLLSLCAREPSRLQSSGSFVRLSLSLREQWLRENVSGGLQTDSSARVGLATAQLYSNTEAFSRGVAIST